jgi:hypothetical protein
MSLVQQPYHRAFAGNPLLFLYEAKNISRSITVALTAGIEDDGTSFGTQFFEYFPYREVQNGVEKFYVRFDLSAIISRLAKPLHKVNTAEGITQNGWLRYWLEIKENGLTVDATDYLHACPGGIPADYFQNLQENGENFFEHILEADTAFMPMTVRNRSGSRLKIRESELGNLAFLYHQVNGSFQNVKINGESLSHWETQGYPGGQVWSAADPYFLFFDLKLLFSIVPDNGGLLLFTIEDIDVFARFEVEVLPDPVSEEKYLLEFRNSLGFTERFLLTGLAADSAETAEAEKYLTNLTGSLLTAYLRPQYSRKLEVSTGYREREELETVQDILLSEEVDFIDLQNSTRRRCLVTAGSMDFERMQHSPQEITLAIDFLTGESRYFPENIVFLDKNLQAENDEDLLTENGEQIMVRTVEDGNLMV